MERTMDKPAQTDYPIEEILKRRWSPRAFSDRVVEPEKLRSLFEAARWAPSSFNEQPWSFIVATMKDQGCSLKEDGAQRAASNKLRSFSGSTTRSEKARGLQRRFKISSIG